MTFEQEVKILRVAVDSPQPTPRYNVSNARRPTFLVLNYGRFKVNRCEMRLLSNRVYDSDILRLLKK